jgi:hypothetical protein
MELKEDKNNIFIMLAVWIIIIVFIYIGVTLFSWGLAVGAFLISSVIIYLQIKELKECLKNLNVDSIIPVSVKLYYYIGILHVIITIVFCLWFLSLFADSVIHNKNKDQIIAELIQPEKAGTMLILTGIWVVSKSVLFVWYDYLVKGFRNFTVSEVFSNFHRVSKIFVGILILLLGIFLYNF